MVGWVPQHNQCRKGQEMTKIMKIETQNHPNGKRTHSSSAFLTPKSGELVHIAIHKGVIEECLNKVGTKGLVSIPELYETDGKDTEEVKVQLVFWCPLSKATWWVTERDIEDPELFFGFCSVVSGGGELGYFRLCDIAEYCCRAGSPAILEDYTGAEGHTLAEVRSAYWEGRLLY